MAPHFERIDGGSGPKFPHPPDGEEARNCHREIKNFAAKTGKVYKEVPDDLGQPCTNPEVLNIFKPAQ